MGLTSGIVWLILVAEFTALGFIGSCFNLRTLRLFTGATAVALAIAVTRFGFANPGSLPPHPNLVDYFLRGVDQVTVALLYPVWHGSLPFPGVAARWVIAAALVLGYRQLEAWAQHWQAPELDLSMIGQGRPNIAGAAAGHGLAASSMAWQRQVELAAELRFRLTTMEVRSPAILPGGTRANALASIAEKSGVGGAGIIGAVLRLVGMIWPGPRRLRVRTWVESAAGTKISVLLEDVKTGMPVATTTVAGESWPEATSMVAGYIARQVFGEDRSVPAWCYGMADGRDLGAMQLVRMARGHASCPSDVDDIRVRQLGILSKYTGSGRTAGFIRYEHAQLLALKGRHLESFRLHALDRELHDRFFRGQYRLAMAIEMIVNPAHYLVNDEVPFDTLKETLQSLHRCGLTDEELPVSAEYRTDEGGWEPVTPPSGPDVPCLRVSRELALDLLKVAIRELREVRTQLNLGHVMWNSLFHRDERAVWLPHWGQGHRQTFRDGVCVAELLVAIRCRFLEPEEKGLSRREQARIRRALRRATRITSFIAGDPAFIEAVLKEPHGRWWAVPAAKAGPAVSHRARSRPRERVQDRVRRLPGQRRTASWQAAYNTACVYAALADAALAGKARAEEDRAAAARAGTVVTGPVQEKAAEKETTERDQAIKELERRVIVSLRRAVENPRSELERPSDWIDHDPDFRFMSEHKDPFNDFKRYLLDLTHQDYPVDSSECPIPHAAAVSAEKPDPVISPVACPVPSWAMTNHEESHEPAPAAGKARKGRPEHMAGARRLSPGPNQRQAAPWTRRPEACGGAAPYGKLQLLSYPLQGRGEV